MGFFDYFKKNKILKTNNEYLSDPKETVAENNSAATRRENPLYTVKGYINEQKIHLGSYFLNPGDWEECYLVFENNDWYLNRESWWPVHHKNGTWFLFFILRLGKNSNYRIIRIFLGVNIRIPDFQRPIVTKL